MKGKKGMEFWQLMLIILALVSLFILLYFIGGTHGEVSKFTEWLELVT